MKDVLVEMYLEMQLEGAGDAARRSRKTLEHESRRKKRRKIDWLI